MKLKDLFFKPNDEIQETSEKKKTIAPSLNNQQSKTTTINTPVSFESQVPMNGSEQTEIVEYFEKTFSEINFDGSDYYEFMVAIKQSVGMAIDDKTKFILTYNGLKAQGADKRKLSTQRTNICLYLPPSTMDSTQKFKRLSTSNCSSESNSTD